MLKARDPRIGRAFLVGLLVSAVTLGGLAQPVAATHSVATLKGFAYGYQLKVSLFGGPLNTRGYGEVACTGPDTPEGCAPNPEKSSSPSVELPASGGSLNQMDDDGSVGQVGPAILHSSGMVHHVKTEGDTAAGGSVTSSTRTTELNISGQEAFTANDVSSTCTASPSGVSGSADIAGGTLETDSGNDVNGDGDYLDDGEHPPAVVAVPIEPTPGTEFTGHIHVNGEQNNWRYVFNEQATNADGSLTVYAAHQYLLGPIAVGDLWVGRADCGVTLPSRGR